MSKLINELKQEHNEIAEMFKTVMKSGATSKKGLDIVKESKIKLLDHLEKEDKFLYPPLFKRAEKDAILRNTLKSYGTEMEVVTKAALQFYEKYSNIEGINRNEFITDMSALNISLKSRVMKEEVSLYRAYEKLNID